MCSLILDVQIEKGQVAADANDPTTVECSEGRVIIAASAHLGSILSTNSAIPVALEEGDPVDECKIAATPTSSGTVTYYLTTVRVATL